MKTKSNARPGRTKSSVQKVTYTSDVIEKAIPLVPLTLALRQILVPIDFSEPSQKALRYAVAFAEQCGAKITLLHVQSPLPLAAPEVGFAAMSYLPQVEPADRSSQIRLEGEAAKWIPPGMLGSTTVRIGVAFDEICKAAEEFRSDLIIVNTHGYTGLKHVLLGSTAERVVRHARCPVLVVRETEHEFA